MNVPRFRPCRNDLAGQQPSTWLLLLLPLVACAPPTERPTLVGYARLPASTFAAGPPSGARLGSSRINGEALPFLSQPVQGFSALIPGETKGQYWALSDNGYGSIENSADFHLRLYRITPELLTSEGGSGQIRVDGFVELHDPDGRVPFSIRNAFTRERILTGADFDPESVVQAPDGSFWFGDELGPFLLHTDRSGRVLEPPIAITPPGQPEHRAPQNALSEESSALRIMNALDAHAQQYGGSAARRPVFSPWHQLIADSDDTVSVPTRSLPPTGSGLSPASSKIFQVESLKKAGFAVVTWTVNDAPRMQKLLELKVDGIISDRPDLLWSAVRSYDGNQDGAPDLLTAEGLIDATRFDAQGHRGGRDLRPENTLPAMEVALDYLMTTLETDVGISADGIPVLSHDPHIMAQKCRRSDGKPYEEKDEILIKDTTRAELQRDFICDKLFRGPQQRNDPSLSPVSVAFASSAGLPHIYAVPTAQQLFDFVQAYVRHYRDGAGRMHPDAQQRVKNAQRVRFNIETKINPRAEFAARTTDADTFAETLAQLIEKNGLSERADVQSFDLRTLLAVQRRHPMLRTVALFGDFPRFANPTISGSDDGTNLQDEDGRNTPWLGGLAWPYRMTAQAKPQRVRTSGGLEAMALTADGQRLLLFLEKPLQDEADFVRGYEFELATRRFLPVEHRYPLSPGSTSIGELAVLSERSVLFLERDDSEARLDGRKQIYLVEDLGTGAPLGKRLLVDLMALADPLHLAGSGQPGDIGVGDTFAFPYFTIESLLPLSPRRIAVMNDNNFPFGQGRHAGSHAPDDSELIVIELPEALPR